MASEHLDRINASRASLSLLPPLHQRPLSRPRNPVASLGSDIQIEMPAARTCFSLCIVCITIAPHVFLFASPLFLVFLLCCLLQSTCTATTTTSSSCRPSGPACAFAFAWERTAAACYAGCARRPQDAERRPGRAQTCSIMVFGGRLSARLVPSSTSSAPTCILCTSASFREYVSPVFPALVKGN